MNRSADSTLPDDSLPRFCVGIDLGTTNCAVAYVDTIPPETEEPTDAATARAVQTFKIPQWVEFGSRERRETLPSFYYELTTAESESVTTGHAWDDPDDDSNVSSVVGVLARDRGSRNPGRRIQSAKSWLSHDAVDRSAPFLPWHGDEDVEKLSPVQATAAYLRHLRQSWDHAHPDDLLAQQDVVVTLPASFDEVARELTIVAAKRAGLPRIHLLEEPQAAFYGWIDREGDSWQDTVTPGDLILVCDVGGGTTDLTLIRVKPAQTSPTEKHLVDAHEGGCDATAQVLGSPQDGTHQRVAPVQPSPDKVQFHRVAVGKHLILGGDNFDLALAKFVEQKITGGTTPNDERESDRDETGFNPQPSQTPPLTADQWSRLIGAARQAKEKLLGSDRPDSVTVHLPNSGSRLIGSAIQTELTSAESDHVLVDGFFPDVDLHDAPLVGDSGFQEMGLPYAADPAITKHLAEFLRQHRDSGIDEGDENAATHPTHVLFNGGVMSATRLQDRIVDSLNRWFGHRPRVLTPARLDLAVSRGAAYYAQVRRGVGVRIAANLGRSYYIQVHQSPPRGIVLIPGNAEPGQVFQTEGHPLELQVGIPVQFPMWVSSVRLADRPGALVELDEQQMSLLPPVRTALVTGKKRQSRTEKVQVEAELSEIGTVGIRCVEVATQKKWKLEFDIRSTLETDREAHQGSGEAVGIVDQDVLDAGVQCIQHVFGTPCERSGAEPPTESKPGKLVKTLQNLVGQNKRDWPPSMLRRFWQALVDEEPGRRRSEAHEARWLNLVGYCLRPGYGVAVDDWRVSESWRRLHGKLAHAVPGTRLETLILWRRIGAGLSNTQQQQLF
ncbi:MAG: Hsp70 family protein, partial [Planctomycetota bacterium]